MVDSLFSNIEQIYSFHVSLLVKMKESGNDLLNVFLPMEDDEWIELYTIYCNNYTNAIKTLEKYCQDPHFKAFFLGCRLLMSQEISLEGYLLVPIQRICRYPLLLAEVLKTFDENDPLYTKAWMAKERVKRLAELVNEAKRREENEKRFLQYKDLFDIEIDFTGNNQLIQLSSAKKISHRKTQTRLLFLFNNILVYTKPLSRKKYSVRGIIPLDQLAAFDVADGTNLYGIELHNAWRLERNDTLYPKTYHVIMSSQKEKSDFLSRLKEAQELLS
ncbi:Dbl homology domain-containing protein [Rozella allomycis CSF55]|uniref:Dbl homology domain-containing protein n=1 Tax=Rozella allomycis (strain CSF55) TaxID=988480 RepID=A0A075AQX6_ROZAC|nr:RhoGEF domain-containing protein 1 [Rozella allomycis CSF55]RKP22063.1 Dbl homology domain-containing protein [Rozella allomycis CSF55]|eukprot:EPZ31085.1 RhoGEF domain-containing protein 1 [Rozella allomycis CSF55]